MRPSDRAFAGVLALAGLALGCGSPPPLQGCEGEGAIEVLCGFQNPEDLAAAPGGEWIVVSQFPGPGGKAVAGSLLALRPSDGERRALFPLAGDSTHSGVKGVGAAECSGPPDVASFSPHGIDLAPGPDGGARLLVVNHGGREAIELFRLELGGDGPTLAWQGCVPLPEDAQANDVAALPGGAFVATHMLPRDPGPLSLLRLALGLATGQLLEWTPAGGWREIRDSSASAPNGVAASSDGETFYFAAWAGSKLVRVGRDGSGRREIDMPHHPDNLSWGRGGQLLVTGQLGSMAKLLACGEIESGTCPIPFSVVAVDPEDLSTETVFVHDPARLGGAGSVALEHSGSLWIGTFAGDRILRVTED